MSQAELPTEQSLEVIEPGSDLSASSSPNPGDITRAIKKALATGHYMGAATACSTLPLGCEVAFSAVKIDLQRETYPLAIGNKRGINKTALNRIGKAIGVNWDTRLSHRTDDGKDPCFASYKAVGHYRDFDGTWRTIEGEKQMDLREGSERAKKMSGGELSEARKFIAEHAQTKAQLRAIRSIGLETSYVPEFYDEPIICARLVFTGRSDNPEIQARFAELTAAAMLGSTNILYGEQTPRGLATSLPEAERQEATAEPEVVQEPEATTCSPGRCIGLRSLTHLEGCFPQQEKSATPQTTKDDNAWAIPGKGPARGLKITDPKVTPDTLLSLLKEYGDALNPQGDLYDKLADEGKDFYSSALREVQKELDRRGINIDGSEKRY
jgi:hypothetical protein